MDERFRQMAESLHPSFERLMAMGPLRGSAPSRATTPKSGIYLFSEGSKHLYVGRSNRIAERYRLHCGPSAKENQASFAWKLTAEVMEHKATYRKGEGRKDKILIPEFADAFRLAKERIRAMEYRFVEEADQTRQALLEAYVCIALGTPYNDFDTH
ncbi:hypothetical protein NP945_00830 [Mesorhizobium sp. LMG17149]|uniref:hypothetical protein n=1 Tax=Mesorhizobium sp. LMG17149 TaxID=2968497 RepID=UPI002119293B|nr:hypothetical protein [Mesorhizobium sp. LMG17149]MCQ8870366.1 hypothetical protein [Mesorhizobium sp. LMG17149]